MTHPTQFDSLLDLARLPWFTVKDGDIALADPSLGKSLDVHVHLAMTYFMRPNVDLDAATDRVETYLPQGRPFSLDNYANQNLSKDDLDALTKDLVWGSFRKGGMRTSHTAGNAQRQMANLGVQSSVLLPIDFPWGISDNAGHWLRTCGSQETFVCFGHVHPYDLDVPGKLDQQRAAGARGIKIHPAHAMVAPDHDRMVRLCQLAGDRGLAVLFHCGPVGIVRDAADRRCQVYRYERSVAEAPQTTFVLGHSGALQWEVARDLAVRYPNVYLELASQGLPVVRSLLDAVPRDRVMFGSDWPFYHQAMGLAKVFMATEDDEGLRRAVLWGNAARVLGLREA